jgi:uncharacterized protein (TIGR02246 family)
MKFLALISLNLMLITTAFAQGNEQAIIDLVDQYGKARAEKNVDLLNAILVEEVDQLVSTGEWRRGLDESLAGMLRSSTRQPGSRSLSVEKVRFITDSCAIADARYVIDNGDGTERKMWSTFVAVFDGNQWKIAAIRNMLPRE